RVKAGGERQARLEAMAANQVADGTLGGDMNAVRPFGCDAPRDRTGMRQRQADLGVRRQRHGGKSIRRKEAQLRAEWCGRPGKLAQRLPDTVDLRVPCIGRNEDADHAARTLLPSAAGPAACASAVQAMISSLPFACSATAVQLSTQSPQLT